jgi:hypothetical protein
VTRLTEALKIAGIIVERVAVNVIDFVSRRDPVVRLAMKAERIEL